MSDQPIVIYQVKDWAKLYENSRTRTMTQMQWVPVPNKQDGDGYTVLVQRENGAAYLGAWLAILQVASKCEPRGQLVRTGNIPHTPDSLARMTRLDEKTISEAILILVNECKWLEIISMTGGYQEGIRQGDRSLSGSLQASDYRMEWNGMEWNGNNTGEEEVEKFHFKVPPQSASEGVAASIEKVKAVVQKIYNRPETAPWTYEENRTLFEVCKRPDVLAELETLTNFQKQPESYFPQSVVRLLADWPTVLDRARVFVPKRQGGLIASEFPAYVEVERYAKEKGSTPSYASSWYQLWNKRKWRNQKGHLIDWKIEFQSAWSKDKEKQP